MRRLLMTTAALMLISSPAWALSITNLDTVPHTVELAGGGANARKVIAPNATESFNGASYGRLSLITAKKAKRAQGSLQADGMLSGIIGNGRTQDIPVDPADNYVIWPDGKILLQSHRKDWGH